MSIEVETYNNNLNGHVDPSVSSSSAAVSSASSSSSSEPEDSYNYESLFPSLKSTNTAPFSFNETDSKLSVKRLQTTTVFHVPVAERKYKDMANNSFGNETNKKCEEIAARLGVKVEMCCSKDLSLHIVISGQEERVFEAKRAIVTELQTERDYKIKISKDQHKFLIGKGGSVLKELQEKTCTKISIPKSDANSDIVTITGPKDGIEQAIHEIQLIIDEQSKTGLERLNIPKLYHPWIRGFNNEIANEISQRTGGAKINIPPPHLDKDEITVSGEREAVDAAVNEIKKIYAQKSKLNITKLAIQITKSQHKLIIGKNGSNLQEIFKDYDVYVLVPKFDSDLETIYLYGEESKLGTALSQVCAKANSIITNKIEVPSWLHRHMIGEKGANISKITADYPQTHVKFEANNLITLEGPPEEVEKVKERLENITVALKQIMICEEVTCEPKYYAQLVGSKANKTENHIAKLNKDFGCVVRLPADSSSSNVVRIEGAPDSVHKCKAEFLELIKRLENERSKDVIIEQKYHSNLIGKNGKHLNEVRAKFNDVQIQIPSQQEKSDVVTMRGNKLDVEKCYKHLQQCVKDIQESNYQEELQIVKEFHRIIIGKGGAFIKKIRDETQTRIDIPPENSDSNTILITGKQDQVRKAKKQIEDKIKELVNIKEDFVDIPHQLHTALIGKNGNIIKHIRSECAGVIINFPPESNPNDNRIVLKGSAEHIAKAKQELLKLAELKHDSNFQDELNVKLEYHKFLVGKNGSKVNNLRDKYQVRIIFPISDLTLTDNNNNNNSITIIGKKENVLKVKEELEQAIKSLEEQITDEVEVDAKWHKNFTTRRAKLINKISEDNCNIKISFPKQSASNQVKLTGPKEAVAAAKKRILDLVFEFENQVVIEVNIPNKYHALVIGKKGVNTQKISDEFNVEIQFQAKLDSSNEGNGAENGAADDTASVDNSNGGSKSDVITISGLKEECEKAKEALLALVPLSENLPFPLRFHKDLLANKAEILRELTNKTNAQVNVPKREENVDYIIVSGQRDSIEAAKKILAEKLTDLELNNYSVEITGMRPEFIPQLRGRNGQEAEKLEKKYKVKIDFSKKDQPDRIVIRGLEKNVHECESFIRKKIQDEVEKLSQTIEIDNRVHSRLIGQRGKSLAKITEKFNVEIKFAGRTSNEVTVKGKNQEQIDDACDYLKNLEEEYLQDVSEKEQYVHPSSRSGANNGDNSGMNGQSKGFVVRGAPWESSNGHHHQHAANEPIPDTSNMEDFPTITSTVNSSNSQKSTWGPSRR